MFSLEQIELTSDLIQMYKIMMDTDGADNEKPFTIAEVSMTRRCRFKERKRRFRKDLRTVFSTLSVSKTWNLMPEGMNEVGAQYNIQ